jgi:asparagine synthase (glutamine-hydrolysing)
MCGVAGIWTRDAVRLADVAKAMADALVHRGPDDGDVWADVHAGIALSHRRLSIIDPSPAGHQPMASPCGRFLVSFNGEIYNHLALRARLENTGPIDWRGHSDTETLVAGIARWGLAETLRGAVGMFALALWDRETRTLHLARDRIGEKPLHYGWIGRAIAFGSELKALKAVPGFARERDPPALALFLRHNVVPTPRSMLKGIYKVEPGAIVTLDERALGRPPAAPPCVATDGADTGVRCQRYWSLDAVVEAGADAALTADDAVERIHHRLREAVRGQMVADRPVGAFLPGGIDSSTVVALMREVSAAPVRTFTIGFAETGFDEAPYARAVARHLGTEHEELYVGSADVLAVIPDLPRIYDEPFADSSQLPAVMLSRLTRRAVTVALSGDGGDELFCGYNRYLVSRRIWEAAARMPAPLRRSIGAAITAVPPHCWDRLAAIPMLGAKAHKVARILRTPVDTIDIYRASSEEWPEGPPLLAPLMARSPVEEMAFAGCSPEERMMRWDMASYLPDDILVKVDRAGMASGLETRMPFLDHRVIEQAWRTPLAFKKRDGQGKWLLRRILDRHVPATLIDRPKAGFAVPVGAWLRGPLRDWAEDLLAERALAADGLLDGPAIRRRWAQHLRGSHDWTGSLWGVLMVRAWATTAC